MRKFSIIDTDIHANLDPRAIGARLPEPWRSRWRDGSRAPQHLGYWNPNGVMRRDTVLPSGVKIEEDPGELARRFFDPYDIEYGVINPEAGIHAGLATDVDYAAAIMTAQNDVVRDEWLPVDPRFRASIMVAPNDPDQAAREIRRAGRSPGFVQVLMCSGARMPYGQRFFHPIYAAACDAGLPVALHPGSEGVGISGEPTAAGYPTSYFEWHTGLVGSYMAHFISLITEGVFVKFPDLRFVLLEGGVCWLPPLLWRLDKNWKALRATTPWLTRPPSEYAQSHVLLSTQPIEEPARQADRDAVLGMFAADRMLMFSSDFPHWDNDTPDFAGRHLPRGLVDRVMSETARELYRLPRRAATEAAAVAD